MELSDALSTFKKLRNLQKIQIIVKSTVRNY